MWGGTTGAQTPAAGSLGPAVNSVYDESFPILSPDGQTLYLVRRRHPQNMGADNRADIWVSYRRAGEGWSRAVHAGTALNDRGVNQVINVSPSGRKLFLLGTEGGRPVLLESVRRDRTWEMPRPLPLPAGRAIRHLHLSADGRYLVFSAPAPEGAHTDLYLSYREEGGSWREVIHLGPVLNTPGDEEHVFLAADGETLYFSSDGHPGLGGQDWFMSRRLDGSWNRWAPPVSLGTTVNSSLDEGPIALPVSGEAIYFTRPVAGAGLDLFRAPLPDSLRPRSVILLSGRLLAGSAFVENARLRVQPLQSDHGLRQLEVLPSGRYALLTPRSGEVNLYAEAEGFFAISERLGLSERDPEEVDPARNMLAVRDLDPAYLDREEEIRDLQLHLRELNDELRRLSREGRPGPAVLFTLPGEDSDPQLEALRHRYGEFVRRDTSREDGLRAKGPTAYEATEGETLEQMKDKYQEHFSEEAVREEAFLWEEDTYLEGRGAQAPAAMDLIETAARELAGELTPEEQQLLERQEAAFKAALRESLNAPRRSPAADTIRSADWQMALEEEVLFKPESSLPVPADTAAFKAYVKDALRGNLDLSRKEERQRQLQRELDRKLQMQMETEAALMAKGLPPAGEENAPAPASIPDRLSRDVRLVPVGPGQVLPLENIFFRADGNTLKPESEPELQRVLDFLRENDDLSVEIGVHTHGWMSHARANQLSEERAAAIANYLILRGVSPGRLSYRGYGKTQPLTTNETAEGRRKNQRVEVKVLE